MQINMMLFYEGTSSNIQTLINFFNKYAQISSIIVCMSIAYEIMGLISISKLKDASNFQLGCDLLHFDN